MNCSDLAATAAILLLVSQETSAMKIEKREGRFRQWREVYVVTNGMPVSCIVDRNHKLCFCHFRKQTFEEFSAFRIFFFTVGVIPGLARFRVLSMGTGAEKASSSNQTVRRRPRRGPRRCVWCLRCRTSSPGPPPRPEGPQCCAQDHGPTCFC